MSKKVTVRRSSVAGRGLFAVRPIKKGEVIFIAKGKTIRYKVNSRKDAQFGASWLALEKGVWLSPNKENPWNYINHSCDPTAGIKGKVTVRARKNIAPGEEVTIDYSTNELEPLWRMSCKCGSPKCRKLIRGAMATDPAVIINQYPFVSHLVTKYLNKEQKKHEH